MKDQILYPKPAATAQVGDHRRDGFAPHVSVPGEVYQVRTVRNYRRNPQTSARPAELPHRFVRQWRDVPPDLTAHKNRNGVEPVRYRLHEGPVHPAGNAQVRSKQHLVIIAIIGG